MVLGKVIARLTAGLDLVDALFLVGLVSFIGGIAAIYRPAAAIVFGMLCLFFWARKNWSKRTWVG